MTHDNFPYLLGTSINTTGNREKVHSYLFEYPATAKYVNYNHKKSDNFWSFHYHWSWKASNISDIWKGLAAPIEIQSFENEMLCKDDEGTFEAFPKTIVRFNWMKISTYTDMDVQRNTSKVPVNFVYFKLVTKTLDSSRNLSLQQ